MSYINNNICFKCTSGYKTIADSNNRGCDGIKNYELDQPALSELNIIVIYWVVFEIFKLNKNTTIMGACRTAWSRIKRLTLSYLF